MKILVASGVSGKHIRVCLVAVLVASLTASAAAQAVTHSCTVTKSYNGCSSPAPQNYATFTNWSYKDPSGGVHDFSVSAWWEKQETYVVNGHNRTCGFTTAYDGAAFSTDGLYYIQTSEAPGTTACLGYVQLAGYINPKFKIVGVDYAPPGSTSSVTYGGNTVVGSSTMFSSSFSNEDIHTVSLSAGGGLYGFTNKETITSSTDYTQEQDTSNSIAVSQTTSYSSSLEGFSDPVNGINHDYDYIQVWLNPLDTFNLFTDSSGKNHVTWTGVGYDLNDTPAGSDMDVIGIQLGCLNGDFYQLSPIGASNNWLTCKDVFNNNFSRTWALTNTDGSGPSLTPTLANSSPPYNFCAQTGTDLYYICLVDPFSNPSYGQEELPPPAGSYTTADGRFTACQGTGCNTTIEYEPSLCPITYSQGYSTTTTQSQGYKNTYQTSFSIESQFGWSGGVCSLTTYCGSFGADTAQTTKYTTIDQFSQSTNNSNGKTASFSICGPAEGYTGPLSFTVYQDNLYGTFMFYPVIK